jgi:hypothetical protein
MVLKQAPKVDDEVQKRMDYGTINEVNALATLSGVILPFLHPHSKYVEEGAYVMNAEEVALFISPDGSIRSDCFPNSESETLYAVEIKCPVPGPHKLPVFYTLPPYYVCQVLCEMAATGVEKLLFISYSAQSTTVLEVTMDSDLLNQCISLAGENFTQVHSLKRPKALPKNAKEIRTKLDSFTKSNVRFLGEFPSRTASPSNLERAISSPGPYVKFEQPPRQSTTDSLKLEGLSEIITAIRSCISEWRQISRKKATEVLVWLLQDTDRQWNEECLHSCPVAYAMRGPSLDSVTMRAMNDSVIRACHEKGVRIVGMSIDGQWEKLVTRDASEKPLTLIQLQKDVWNEANSQSKQSLCDFFRTEVPAYSVVRDGNSLTVSAPSLNFAERIDTSRLKRMTTAKKCSGEQEKPTSMEGKLSNLEIASLQLKLLNLAKSS